MSSFQKIGRFRKSMINLLNRHCAFFKALGFMKYFHVMAERNGGADGRRERSEADSLIVANAADQGAQRRRVCLVFFPDGWSSPRPCRWRTPPIWMA